MALRSWFKSNEINGPRKSHKKMIAIINYGSGNIRALSNALGRLNIPFLIAQKSQDLDKATKLILPGVGAHDQTMHQLEKSGMKETLNKLVIDKKIPILGICVGMQIMANKSEEGSLKGLGWINGDVKKMDPKERLPHMGWNNITQAVANPLLTDIDDQKGFYFLHSFSFNPHNSENILTTTNYGKEFVSAVHSDNIYGVQFHPEKSHQNGLTLLKNFSKYA